MVFVVIKEAVIKTFHLEIMSCTEPQIVCSAHLHIILPAAKATLRSDY